MHYYIITGASRGLGEAIAKKLLAKNSQIYCLSRTASEDLISFSENNGFNLQYVTCDLNNISDARDVLDRILDMIPQETVDSISLINNAARIDPILPIESCDTAEINKTFNVNLVTPIIFTSTFIQKLKGLKVDKKVVNISSTGSKQSYEGLSCYISSKAALSQFSKVVAAEQKGQENPVRIFLFEPGSMDTSMQNKITSTTKRHFSWIQRFREVRRQGLLGSVEGVADQVFRSVSGKFNPAGDGKLSQILMTTVMYLPEMAL